MPQAKTTIEGENNLAPKLNRLQQRLSDTSKGLQSVSSITSPACIETMPAVAPIAIKSTANTLRAFELLATQPISLVGMTPVERDRIVVTAVADTVGHEHVVSRFGDHVWELASEIKAMNRRDSDKRIVWPSNLPKSLVDDAKAALYCALRRGPRGRSWAASAVIITAIQTVPMLKHLADLGLENFSQVRALYLSDYIADLRRTLSPSTVQKRLQIVDLVWSFQMDVLHPLPQHPWAGRFLTEACGVHKDESEHAGRSGKTPVIPRSVQYALFEYCTARIGETANLLQTRDIADLWLSKSYQFTAFRRAVLYMLQITSGMRNSESTGVTNGCWRTEVRNGVTYHWVRTSEIKTTGGTMTDFLVPPESIHALHLLQRYVRPLQTRLSDEAKWLEKLLAQGTNADGRLGNGMTTAAAVHRLNHVRAIGQHIFLAVNNRISDHLGTGSRVEVMNISGCNHQLKKLAKAAGTDWNLANHQCRRTFAYNVANSKLGRMGLVFLKWQLKHASMSWTQLYAANPYQDHGLYRELEEEMIEARLGLMEGWTHLDIPLGGGAGKKIMQTRARATQNLTQLLRLSAESVELRSTGHAWCISGTRGCHGQGIYEPTMCGNCSQAIIDQEQAPTWQMIHMDNLQLAAITDCGPGLTEKARRAVERSEQVLKDLGVTLPSDEQRRAHAAALRLT